MKFSHSRNNSLTCLIINTNFKARIFFCKFIQRITKLLFIDFSFRLNSNRDNRVWKIHCFKNYWVFFTTKSRSCSNAFKTNNSTDISCFNFWNIFSFVCMHSQKSSNTFRFTCCRVINLLSNLEYT